MNYFGGLSLLQSLVFVWMPLLIRGFSRSATSNCIGRWLVSHHRIGASAFEVGRQTTSGSWSRFNNKNCVDSQHRSSCSSANTNIISSGSTRSERISKWGFSAKSRNPLLSRNTITTGSVTGSLFSAKVNGSNEDTNDDNANEDEELITDKNIPQTGWNHNLPSESSQFWQSAAANSAKESSSGTASNVDDSSASSSTTQFRTGWLHNKKSPSSTQTGSDDAATKISGTGLARKRLERAMKQQELDHRLLTTTLHACGGEGGLGLVVVTEHQLSVPLIYRDSGIEENSITKNQDQIDVYFTVVEKSKTPESQSFYQNLAAGSNKQQSPQQRALSYVEFNGLENANNMVLYLQGGPGYGSPSPIVGLEFTSPDASWAAKALSTGTFDKIVLMDQRGTGRSTPITKQTLEQKFPDLFLLDNNNDGNNSNNNPSTLAEIVESSNPAGAKRVQVAVQEVTNYMSHFRADNIVRDAEFIKDALFKLPDLKDEAAQDSNDIVAKPWGCALGQSFGGFCLMTYLSLIKNPPTIVLFTGGIAPMLSPVYDVYSKLWGVVKERSLRYYEMYPEDVELVKKIVRSLVINPVKLPSGGTLTARRFLQLGLALGGSPSAFASMHTMLSSALLASPTENHDVSNLQFTRAFLKDIDIRQSFDDHPIYYWLHEAIYADGPSSFNVPTEWAAHRAYLDTVKKSPEFDYEVTCQASDERPVLFFGEMVFPWMAEDYAELNGVGLTAVANELSSKTDWLTLYDCEKMKAALSDDGGGRSKCKAAAAVYQEDMYVEFGECLKVTARDGPLGKCKIWVTNEYQHSGLRDAGGTMFAKLYGMATGSVRTPS